MEFYGIPLPNGDESAISHPRIGLAALLRLWLVDSSTQNSRIQGHIVHYGECFVEFAARGDIAGGVIVHGRKMDLGQIALVS